MCDFEVITKTYVEFAVRYYLFCKCKSCEYSNETFSILKMILNLVLLNNFYGKSVYEVM